MQTKMTNEQYHAMTDRAGTSTLKVFIDDPTMYYHYYVAKTMTQVDISDKPGVMTGDLVHQVLLDRKNISDVAVEYTEECYKKNGAINPHTANAFREEMRDAGKVVMKPHELAQIKRICESAAHSDLARILNHPEVICEEPLFWRDMMSDITCKGKPDAMIVEDNTVHCYDLKVTSAVNPNEWSRIASRFKYWLQVAHYTNGIMHCYPNHSVDFTFYVVENRFPYRVVSYRYDEDSFNRAWDKYTATMQDLKRRMIEDDWTADWEHSVNELTIKPWELCETEDEELEGFDD